VARQEAGPRFSGGEDFRALTNGRYRRRNAPFTITAVNGEVGWKTENGHPTQ
jgi:hypothetical protein